MRRAFCECPATTCSSKQALGMLSIRCHASSASWPPRAARTSSPLCQCQRGQGRILSEFIQLSKSSKSEQGALACCHWAANLQLACCQLRATCCPHTEQTQLLCWASHFAKPTERSLLSKRSQLSSSSRCEQGTLARCHGCHASSASGASLAASAGCPQLVRKFAAESMPSQRHKRDIKAHRHAAIWQQRSSGHAANWLPCIICVWGIPGSFCQLLLSQAGKGSFPRVAGLRGGAPAGPALLWQLPTEGCSERRFAARRHACALVLWR